MSNLLEGIIGIISMSEYDLATRMRMVRLYWQAYYETVMGISRGMPRPELGAFVLREFAPDWLREAMYAFARDVVGRFYSEVISTVGLPIVEFYSEVRNRLFQLIPSANLREALARRDRMLIDAVRGYSNLLAYVPDYRLEEMEKEFWSKLLRRERIIDEKQFLEYLRDVAEMLPFHPKDKKDIVYGAMKEMGIQVTKEKLKYVLGYDYYRATGIL